MLPQSPRERWSHLDISELINLLSRIQKYYINSKKVWFYTLVESKITNPIKMKACIVLIVLAVAVQAQKFEPAKCDYSKEIYCSGTWNEDWTEQITADFCIPMQNGDCWNYCPTQCCKDSVMCPGKMDPKGCKEPDFCHHGSKYFSNAIWSLISFFL